MLDIVQMRVELSTLVELPDNPHFMTETEYELLKENIERDGGIKAQPILCWRMHDDATKKSLPTLMILDGNHRKRACIDLGIEEETVNVITNYLTEEERLQIALRHNNLHGTDDLKLLIAMFEKIKSPKLKSMTGLTSNKLGLFNPAAKLGTRPPGLVYNVISINFLPTNLEHMQAALDAAGERVKASTKYVASYADYDAFMDALSAARKKRGVINVAGQLAYIIDVFMRHVDDED